MSQAWHFDFCEIRMMNTGCPLSHWNLKSHGNAQVYEVKLVVQLLVAGRRGAGAPAEHCSPEGSLLTGLHWAGPDQQVRGGTVPNETALQSCWGHTHLHCERLTGESSTGICSSST